MNLKGRLNSIQKSMPLKIETDEQVKHLKKVSTWLIDNEHEEYINCVRETWRISIQGDEVTPSELAEYERLSTRMVEIIEEYSKVDGMV